jgi:hypothetical protein
MGGLGEWIARREFAFFCEVGGASRVLIRWWGGIQRLSVRALPDHKQRGGIEQGRRKECQQDRV